MAEEGGEGELGPRAHHRAVRPHGACGLPGFGSVGGTGFGAIHVGNEDDPVGARDLGGFRDCGGGHAHPVRNHEDGGGWLSEGVIVDEDALELGVRAFVGDLLLDHIGGEGGGEEGEDSECFH